MVLSVLIRVERVRRDQLSARDIESSHGRSVKHTVSSSLGHVTLQNQKSESGLHCGLRAEKSATLRKYRPGPHPAAIEGNEKDTGDVARAYPCGALLQDRTRRFLGAGSLSSGRHRWHATRRKPGPCAPRTYAGAAERGPGRIFSSTSTLFLGSGGPDRGEAVSLTPCASRAAPLHGSQRRGRNHFPASIRIAHGGGDMRGLRLRRYQAGIASPRWPGRRIAPRIFREVEFPRPRGGDAAGTANVMRQPGQVSSGRAPIRSVRHDVQGGSRSSACRLIRVP